MRGFSCWFIGISTDLRMGATRSIQRTLNQYEKWMIVISAVTECKSTFSWASALNICGVKSMRPGHSSWSWSLLRGS